MEIEPEYQAMLDYLYSFVDFSLQKNLTFDPEKFNLERIRAFAAGMGDPHLRYPVIHIAGSKGKGSVAALCASALGQAGYRVGLYTSPHLNDYNERIQVNSQPISHAELIQLVDEMKPVIESVPQLSTFEITTGLAFLYFARRQVEIAVIEVGLGGRLDATNIVSPDVSVITTLGYEHTAILGNTLTQIATEKGGIIKPGRPVVLAPQQEEARRTIERICADRNAPLIEVGRDYLYSLVSQSIEQQVFAVSHRMNDLPESRPAELTIPLLGRHQVENAATAYAVLDTIRNDGLRLPEEAIEAGFASVHWPGRFEILRRDPPVVIDSAHTRDAAQKLRMTLDDYFPGVPVVLVFGASEDKDIVGMLAELASRVKLLIAVRADHPRAIEPAALIDAAEQVGIPARAVEHVNRALEIALQEAQNGEMVLVTGSIFVTAEAREAWFIQNKAE